MNDELLMLSTYRTVVSLGALAAAFASAPGAVAQGLGDFVIPKEWEVGGIVLAAPKYDGASKYRAIGFPIAFPAGIGESRIDIKASDDVRLRLVSFQGFEIGPVAGWRFSRDESDGRRLRGLGDIDGGLAIGGYAAYRIGGLSAFASYSHQATGDDTGDLIRFGLESKLPIQKWMTLTALVGATWANEEYMRTYFGISPAQAARSGNAVYTVGSGIKDVHVALTAEIPMSDVWTLRLMGRYAQLIGDAADSPIVEREGQLSGGIGLTYKFNFGR